MVLSVDRKLVKRFGAVIMVVNIAVAFFSFTDMYLLASGAIQVEYPDQTDFETSFDVLNLEFVFRSEYTVTNGGFYNIKDMGIRSILSTETGETLIDYETPGLEVARWSEKTFVIEARLPLENLLELDLEKVLFENETFILEVEIGADYVMGLVHFGLDQVREYPWDGPLYDYSDVLGMDALVAIVEDLLDGDYSEASDGIEAAIYGAFVAAGGEVRVSLNDITDLVIYLEDDIIHVVVELAGPFDLDLIHLEVSLTDIGLDGYEEEEVWEYQGGTADDP